MVKPDYRQVGAYGRSGAAEHALARVAPGVPDFRAQFVARPASTVAAVGAVLPPSRPDRTPVGRRLALGGAS
jgi:hypothetical protein